MTELYLYLWTTEQFQNLTGGVGVDTSLLKENLSFCFASLFFSLSLWKDAKCSDIITGLPEPPLIICKNDFNRQTLLLHSGTEKLSGIWLEKTVQ